MCFDPVRVQSLRETRRDRTRPPCLPSQRALGLGCFAWKALKGHPSAVPPPLEQTRPAPEPRGSSRPAWAAAPQERRERASGGPTLFAPWRGSSRLCDGGCSVTPTRTPRSFGPSPRRGLEGTGWMRVPEWRASKAFRGPASAPASAPRCLFAQNPAPRGWHSVLSLADGRWD